MDAQGLEFLIDMRDCGALPARGSVAEIGAQELFLQNRADVLRRFVDRFNGNAAADELERLSNRGPARRLFELSNWSYMSIDTSAEFGAIPLDMNFDKVPVAHKGRYHLVTNFGTTEHIANQLNSFEVIHDLATAGGLMVHAVPAQGFVDHGLLNYSPKFFWRLAEYNNYQLVDMRMTSHGEIKPLPQGLSQTFSSFNYDHRVQDMVMWVAFRKVSEAAFVPPFDGAIRDDALSKRYPNTLVKKYNDIM
jgi:hypothetical protein